MSLRKYKSSGEGTSVRMAPLDFPRKVLEKANALERKMSSNFSVEADVDIDLREVYFLIMHFLSAGPCKRTYGQLWNELLEHQLLPRRYHAWYSRSGVNSGNDDDDGTSLPLGYHKLTERYPHVAKDHLIRLLKQLILNCSTKSPGISGGGTPNAADVPTLLGSGQFSLLGPERDMDDNDTNKLPGYQRWPHMHADQVRGLSLRELGGGFTKHHRAPSVRAACYAIAKPSTLVQKMEIIKKLRGHQNSVYCATFDRSGRYVITGSDDRLVKIWSMETAFCLASCRGHEGDITDLAVSSNNALVASSSNDFIIRVWRLPDGMQISVLRGHIGSVTAIAFSPRPGAVYQLLSSSDDGTCRIWDARNSSHKPRIYIPKPLDIVAGKNTDPSPNSSQRSHHILCCAFNANGTVFVTGSSDNFARVWNACKGSPDDSEQPNNEMDVLAGHENDVNYVQFSGCAVPSRSSVSDNLREDNLPKFKNSWFTHDNIVTCSRDGSAIIWIPRSRRSHGKVGRWTRAYHLKVPPPPMPPQPPRGGPRQRYQPTPRGVNMIIWSLDNRFVLAAIMDCRICVWNSSDGSLVHSLNGHQESTFVLDVHPFNPRIAMSAGYDGKMIIWDIWEGKPVRVYETGTFKLVDGKFSPDGTSIILSDEVGQIYIVTTGEGESQKDAKYDQFFLGDYRPLMQDTHGNALDQETQLTPHRRNIQDLLCDSSMIPYSEPYQSMYQRRRLGIMGLEWRPTSLNFAIGPTYNVNIGDFQPLPIVDLEQWIEPLPEIVDVVDWEHENEIQTDDTDSEYNVTDEFPSEGEQESLGNSSCAEAECSGEDGAIDHENNEGLRRSKRKNPKFEVEITTSSGRRVKRRNLDDHDAMGMSRSKKPRKSRNGRLNKRKKLSESTSSRPQRVAARNARNLLCKITGGITDDEDDESEGDSSESDSDIPESMAQCVDSERSMDSNLKHSMEKEFARDEREGVPESSPIIPSQTNPGSSRKLILKLSRPRSKTVVSSECERTECHGSMAHLQSLANHSSADQSASCGPTDETKEQSDKCFRPTYFTNSQATSIKWGEVKMRSSKRLKVSDTIAGAYPDGPSMFGGDTNESSKVDYGHQINFSRSIGVDEPSQDFNGKAIWMPSPERSFRPSGPSLHHTDHQDQVETLGSFELADKAHCHPPMNFELEDILEPPRGSEILQDDRTGNTDAVAAPIEDNTKVSHLRFKIKSKGLGNEVSCSSSGFKSVATGGQNNAEYEIVSNRSAPNGQITSSIANEEDENTNGSGNLDSSTSGNARPSSSHDLKMALDSNAKMFSSVYKRSKSSRDKKNSGNIKEEDKPLSNNRHDGEMEINLPNASTRRTRFKRAVPHEISPSMSSYAEKQRNCSRDKGKSILNVQDEHLCDEWKSPSKLTVGLRSARNRRENYSSSDLRNFDKGKNHHSLRKFSWLMLSEHEASCRYIPQKGDEVAYLRQGHEQYLRNAPKHEPVPWQSLEGDIKAVELCKVQNLEYCTVPGSGDSGCKLILEFIDPSSDVVGKSFQVTFLELVSDPDFLVERTRYEASMERKWTRRDKCQVWWRNADGNGGSWWEGRVMAVIPKSQDFPNSPWERYQIQYKDDPSCPQMHSPWELYDDPHWEHPHIDDDIRKHFLDSILKVEEDSHKNKDYHGIQKLNHVAQKSDFLNRYPVPLSLEVIKMRLINYYYRTREAVQHDAMVMLSNAESYFAKSGEMRMKMHRLSEWLAKLFGEL